MRVLQVIDTLEVGGAEKMMVLLSNLLHRNGMTTAVLLLTKEGPLLEELDTGIEIHFLNRKQRFNIAKLKETARIVSQYDVVHIHLKHSYRYVSLACLLYGFKTPKLILHDHSHLLRLKKGSWRAVKDWFFKNLLKPQYYIGVNNEQVDWAQLSLNIKKSHCFLLENVVEKKEVKSFEKKSSGVVMVGNISRIKNIEFALRLIQKTNQRLTIFGNVIDERYFNELKHEIRRLEISSQVDFIHNVTNVQPYLPRFAYALHTSKKETGPLVLIEYLAHQLPFVAYGSGQVYEKTKKELPACFCTNFSETDWLQKIDNLHLIAEESLHQCYIDTFSTANYLQTCQNIYKNILRS